jgi:hypothetical protein
MQQFLLFGHSNVAGADAIPPQPWQAAPSDERSRLYLLSHLKDTSQRFNVSLWRPSKSRRVLRFMVPKLVLLVPYKRSYLTIISW